MVGFKQDCHTGFWRRMEVKARRGGGCRRTKHCEMNVNRTQCVAPSAGTKSPKRPSLTLGADGAAAEASDEEQRQLVKHWEVRRRAHSLPLFAHLNCSTSSGRTAPSLPSDRCTFNYSNKLLAVSRSASLFTLREKWRLILKQISFHSTMRGKGRRLSTR